MWLPNQLRLWKRRASQGTRPARRRKTATTRLSLEALEDRTLPSASFGSAFRIGPDQPNPSGGGGQGVATDASGNVYITGQFDGSVDFDPNHPGTDGLLTSKNNASNSYVAKYTSDGVFLWAQRMGGDGTSGPADLGKALAVDGSGNVYVVGSYSNNADFGSTTLTTAQGDGFITKLNSSGAFQWVTPFTDGDGGGMEGVAVDGNGNLYLTRTTNPTGASTSPNLFAAVDKLTDNGTSAAVDGEDTFGNTGSNNVNTGTSIEVDSSGNVFVSGTFTGIVDFNPGPGTSTLTSPKVKGKHAQEGFVLELTSANSFVWAKEIAAMPNDPVLFARMKITEFAGRGAHRRLGGKVVSERRDNRLTDPPVKIAAVVPAVPSVSGRRLVSLTVLVTTSSWGTMLTNGNGSARGSFPIVPKSTRGKKIKP